MFSYEQIKNLNHLELSIYKYITGHPREVSEMTIRKFATATHVSATTILRFLRKMEYSGFAEFKFALQHNLKQQANQPVAKQIMNSRAFFEQMGSADFRAKINQASEMVMKAETITFVGVGMSGALASYGARLLADYGLYTELIDDPWQIKVCAHHNFSQTLLIALSVSGESSPITEQVTSYQAAGAEVLTLTANRYSTIAELADLMIDYDLPENQLLAGTTPSQLPVLYLLEHIAQKSYQNVLDQSKK